MSRKKITKIAKLQFMGGGAKPGPALASAGINMPQFCTAFNDATKDRKGEIVPVVITAYEDKSFEFVVKTTPAAALLKKAAGIEKGSNKGANNIVATLTKDDIKKIAEIKMPDLNAYDLDAAINIVAGTARNMGIAIKGLNDGELAEQAKEAEAAAANAAKLDAELAEMEESAKALAEGVSVEVESTEQDKKEETEDEE